MNRAELFDLHDLIKTKMSAFIKEEHYIDSNSSTVILVSKNTYKYLGKYISNLQHRRSIKIEQMAIKQLIYNMLILSGLICPNRNDKELNKTFLAVKNNIIFAKCKEIIGEKNADYTANHDTSDALTNFKAAKTIGLEPEHGLLLRCMDKLKRIETFFTSGQLSVKTESCDDAICDTINYMVFLWALLEERISHE